MSFKTLAPFAFFARTPQNRVVRGMCGIRITQKAREIMLSSSAAKNPARHRESIAPASKANQIPPSSTIPSVGVSTWLSGSITAPKARTGEKKKVKRRSPDGEDKLMQTAATNQRANKQKSLRRNGIGEFKGSLIERQKPPPD